MCVQVCVRASKVSSEDKPQQPATGHLWCAGNAALLATRAVDLIQASCVRLRRSVWDLEFSSVRALPIPLMHMMDYFL